MRHQGLRLRRPVATASRPWFSRSPPPFARRTAIPADSSIHRRSLPHLRHPAVPAGDGGTEPPLVAAKTTIMSADYRGDRAELARLRDEVPKLDGGLRLGYLAHYWAGTASWRVAINGASANVSQADLRTHLESAAENFAAAPAPGPRVALRARHPPADDREARRGGAIA